MPRVSKLTIQAEALRAGQIDKWEFFESTRRYPIRRVAEASGVRDDEVRTGRRDLRKMNPTRYTARPWNP